MEPFRIGIIGEFQSGKSLLINCILHRSVATVGTGCSTTHTIVNYMYGHEEHIEHTGSLLKYPLEQLQNLDTSTNISAIDVYLSVELLKNFTLIDIPGFGANENDTKIASDILSQIDFAILVASNGKALGSNSTVFKDIMRLQSNHIPYYFFLNCTNADRWRCDEESNIIIMQNDLALLDEYKPMRYPLGENGINIVNFMWYWYSVCPDDDELINRQKNQNSFGMYGITRKDRTEVGIASNFELINKLFDMNNQLFLELRREMKNEILRLKDEVCPVGTIQAFTFTEKQDGWLVCDGSLFDIEEYPELFNVIRFTFGGDNYTKFQIPDLRGRFVRGWSNGSDVDNGRQFGSAQEDAIQKHEHKTIPTSTSSNGSHTHRVYYKSYYVGSNSFSDNDMPVYEVPSGYDSHYSYGGDPGTNSNGNHSHSIPELSTQEMIGNDIRISDETRPKNIALQYCIKAKNSNSTFINDAPIAEVDINELYSIDEGQYGTKYEGFVLLTSKFRIKYNSNYITDEYIRLTSFDENNFAHGSLDRIGDIYKFKNNEKGLYYLKCDCGVVPPIANQFDGFRLTKIESFGVVGDFNEWKESIGMVSDATGLKYSCEVKMKKGDLFRFWAYLNNRVEVELNGDFSNLTPLKSEEQDLICNESGVYDIILDIHSLPWHCELRKKIITNKDNESVKPSDPDLDINKLFKGLGSFLKNM